MSHQARLSEEVDLNRVSLGERVDGLTLRDKVASSPNETSCKGAARVRKWRVGARTGCVVSRTWEGRNNAAVLVLQVVETYSSHKTR